VNRQRIHPAPFAVCCDGSILVNVNGYTGETDLEVLIRRAIEDGRQIFVGSRLESAEASDLLRRIQDPCFEMTGFTLGVRERRRRRAARESGKRSR
jgi:hypothetical protein